ncbi:MAG: glycosyltransferase family 39 protein [Solirubrobacteraceae bacterium]
MSTSEFPASGYRGRRPSALAGARAISVDMWILAALIVLAAAIRIITLDNQSLWTDEALTAYEASLPFGSMLHAVVRVETTPPLYFVLIWGWAKVFGTGAVALRSVSAISGVAIVPIAYASARELLSRRAGVLAAAFVAVNPFMIWYSQEARSYMLVGALTGASFLFFARAVADPDRPHPSRRNLVWWAGLSALAVMSHFFAGFAVAPEAVWLLWRWRTRAVALAVAVVAAAQLAVLPFALLDTTGSYGVGWIAKVPLANRVATTVIEWGASNLYRRTIAPGGLAIGAALAIAVALLVIFGGDRRTRRGAGVAAAIAAFVFAAPIALGLVGQDYFLSRNEIPAFVPVVTVLAAACVAPRARGPGAALAAALLAAFCFTAIEVQTHPYLERADWRSVARSLGPAVQPRAILAADGTTADPLKIYLPGVSWTQPHDRRVRVSELDVVGATKRMRLAAPSGLRDVSIGPGATSLSTLRRARAGAPVPRSVAPPGATLLARFRIHNWIVARFRLSRPELVSVDSLIRAASRFFRRTPAALLIFMQPRAH